MTVRIIPEEAKKFVINSYLDKIFTVAELAAIHNVSRRTICRVLEEAGYATPVPRLKGEAYTVMKLLEEFNVSVNELQEILELRQVIRTTGKEILRNQNAKPVLLQVRPVALPSIHA
jgi:hypothetical protein